MYKARTRLHIFVSIYLNLCATVQQIRDPVLAGLSISNPGRIVAMEIVTTTTTILPAGSAYFAWTMR